MTNTNAKPANPLKVITGPDTRWSYANVWEPKSINGGTPKYSISLIIPKSDTRTVRKLQLMIMLLPPGNMLSARTAPEFTPEKPTRC